MEATRRVVQAAGLGVRAMGDGLAVANGLAPCSRISAMRMRTRGWACAPRCCPRGGRVTVVADRGGSDLTRDRFRKEVGVESISRFRRVVYVTSADGERRQAKHWRGAGGRMRVLRGARVTAEGQPVPMVVGVQQTRMQELWRLASSRSDLTGAAIAHRDSTRFMVEETFRDVQNPRLGLKPTVMGRNDRRDALFLLAVLAHPRLIRLGTAGEELGMDPPKRTISITKTKWSFVIFFYGSGADRAAFGSPDIASTS